MRHFIKALLQFNNEIILQTLELWAKWNCLSCGLTYLVMIMKINSKSIYRYFKTQLLNVFFIEYVCVHSYWMFSFFSICIFISIKMIIVYLSIFFYCSPSYFLKYLLLFPISRSEPIFIFQLWYILHLTWNSKSPCTYLFF